MMWNKLNRFVEENLVDGSRNLELFETYEQKFNGKVYRAHIRLDEFDGETIKLATVILGTYDLIDDYEYDPVGFEIPSNLFNYKTSIVNALLPEV
ncbi:hypothetical protein M5X00_24135 [Paenibacillus alvei]|uniref:Phage protein n=1 Tax=Paenibacillus alvei TaxID=44250 RepID=A0ABT4GR61_PAEAL|nr:hypothetical protein [Paenibacillus alvei]MCY9543609.1 hypothetical protein [Paenibacillus alvei]MCY9737321.1 hypothetical protein [Paenibacillus alvei]MCY9757319.1 hypothetical protein [Paenibacillus alvei]MCY9759150.1 hypothetical protein [Paenibacillus alvei]MCY9770391.1 hypothetical protein [Paenibacillus alvei]